MSRWAVVLPIRPWGWSLGDFEAPASVRFELARAMSLDVLETIERSSMVSEVCLLLGAPSTELSAGRQTRTMVDASLAHGERPSRALDFAVRWAARRSGADRVAIVQPDLASLTTTALDTALVEAADHREARIVGLEGGASTLVATRDVRGFSVRDGHLADHLECVDERVRAAVQTRRGLELARALSLGQRSRDVVRRRLT